MILARVKSKNLSKLSICLNKPAAVAKIFIKNSSNGYKKQNILIRSKLI